MEVVFRAAVIYFFLWGITRVVGKRELVQFCKLAEGGNPMYRRGQMESALKVIERAVQLAAPPSR